MESTILPHLIHNPSLYNPNTIHNPSLYNPNRGLNYFNEWVFVDPGRLIQNLEKDQERKQSAFQAEQDPKPKTDPDLEPEPEPCFPSAEEKMDYLGYLNLVTHDKKNGNIQILKEFENSDYFFLLLKYVLWNFLSSYFVEKMIILFSRSCSLSMACMFLWIKPPNLISCLRVWMECTSCSLYSSLLRMSTLNSL